ncbi:MAG TPA: hypothetical protein VN963_05180 [bacterium]|nr:hypothetical protein [bacterium]
MNQIAMEQAALQAAKNQQDTRVRAETAEEILKQQEKKDAGSRKNPTTSTTDPNGKKKSNSENFKNVLNSKNGNVQTNSDTLPTETLSIPKISHIDFKA